MFKAPLPQSTAQYCSFCFSQSRADGELYMDDGHTFEFQSGTYNYKNLTFENDQLSSKYDLEVNLFRFK